MTDFPDRAAVRAELAALFKGNLTGAGKLVQTVYSFTVKDFGGASPVMVVGSGGTEMVPFTARGSRPVFSLDLWTFVLYADVKENGELTTVDDIPLAEGGVPVWSEADSEAALDAIEAGVRQLLDSNPRGANWKSIKYAGPSTVDQVPVGDQVYRRELTPLRVEVF